MKLIYIYILLASFSLKAQKVPFEKFQDTTSALAHDSSIVFFKGTLEEAKKEAARQNKYLFVDCYTSWCGPCRKMEQEVFVRKEVADFFNKHFICLMVDMEKGEGIAIAKDNKIHGYPTQLYYSPGGDKVHSGVGSTTPDKFIVQGQTAMDDQSNYNGLRRRFIAGERDMEFLKKLIYATNEVNHDTCEKALAMYWDMIPENDFFTKENYELFKYNETDINSKAFTFVYYHHDEFLEKFVAKKDYSEYGDMADWMRKNDSDLIYKKAAGAIKTAADKYDPALFKKAKDIALRSKNEDIMLLVCIEEIRYYKQTGNLQPYLADVTRYMWEYGPQKHYLYYTFARSMLLNTDNKDVLVKALTYSEKAMYYDWSYNTLDLNAHILYKLKRYSEARVSAVDAIGLAQNSQEDSESASKLLKDIDKAQMMERSAQK